MDGVWNFMRDLNLVGGIKTDDELAAGHHKGPKLFCDCQGRASVGLLAVATLS